MSIKIQESLGGTGGGGGVWGTIIGDIANQTDVGDLVTGSIAALDVKNSVRVATNAPLPTNTRTGNVITASADGALPAIDTSVTLVATNRLLVKNEVTAANNGTYTVTAVGDSTHPFILTRTTDADTSAKVTAGLNCIATEGANAPRGWVLTTVDPITLNSTALAFANTSPANITGNAATATKLLTARAINGVDFDGTAPITVADSTKVVANGAITPGTNTKLTYDAKGLVTAGAAASMADIALGTATTGQVAVADTVAGIWRPTTTLVAAGVEDIPGSALSFVDGTQTFTIAPTGASYQIWVQNIAFTISTPRSVVVPATLGWNYIYFDSTGTLVTSITPWDKRSGLIAPVATLYYTGTLGDIGDHRGSWQRSRVTNDFIHATIGAAYEDGFAGTFADTTLSVTAGHVWAQDIRFSHAIQTTTSLWYRNPALDYLFAAGSTKPYAVAGGVLQYDNAGTLTNVPGAGHVTNWVYATNNPLAPIATVVSTQTGTLAQARLFSPPALPTPVRSWKLCFSVIYKNNGGTPTFIESSDYRSSMALLPPTIITTLPAQNITTTPAGTNTETDAQATFTGIDTRKAALAGAAFTGPVKGAVTVLTSSGASVAVNLALSNNFSLTMSENSTLAAPSNPVAGQGGCITITQGAAVARTLAYNGFWKFPSGYVPPLTVTLSAVDSFWYYVESGSRATCRLIPDVR
jgi:hypothetical protein